MSRHRYKSESESLQLLLEDFLSDSAIKERFKFIHDNNITGCEKWIQFELYKFLAESEDIKNNEVYWEDYFDIDSRKDKTRSRQFIDLTFLIKNKRYYISIELKFKNHFAFESVKSDLIKNRTIKPSQKIYFRKVFGILFHPHIEESRITNKAYNDNVINHEFSIPILTTNQLCSVFSSSIY